MARDLRFQNTPSDGDRAFAIAPGNRGPYCSADFKLDVSVDGQDVETLCTAWQAGGC